ncbi:MAG: hypothetical protein IT305_00445 [Chloroflexi bacterium]|nr:hypothetical protein [Chloroflexota bacterium]
MTRTAAETLADVLSAGLATGGASVTGWRFEVHEGQSVRVGLRHGSLGGPYVTPAAAARLSGSLELRWSDGAVSRAGLDRAALLAPTDRLDEWRAAAFEPRWLAPLPGTRALPTVQTHDPFIANLVTGDIAPLFSVLAGAADRLARGGDSSRTHSASGGEATRLDLENACRPLGRVEGETECSENGWSVHTQHSARPREAERVSGSVVVGAGRRVVRSSAGFHAAWAETRCALDLGMDDLTGEQFASRRWPTDAELAVLLEELTVRSAQLAVEDDLPAGECGVVFAPAAFEALLRRFLMPNLDVRAMLEGRATFSLDDVRAGCQVAAPAVSIRVDTTVPYGLATSPCSSEGIPAGCIDLVSEGRLRHPLVDPGVARPAGFAPTPVPRGRPCLIASSDSALDSLEAACSMLGTGVVVREVMGLHTQDARRGSFSLLVPDAQVVRLGRPGGRVAVRVSGRFFLDLLSPGTALVRFRQSLSPGLLVRSDVTVEPV